KSVRLTQEQLRDKIKGGWAGQTIGVTFGGPTEFRYQGSMIQDYQPIAWYSGYLKETYEKSPGLYDDIYMDLTFVDIFSREGLDAPVQSFAKAYAEAGYMLWHANQAGRYNILHGMQPPASGHWLNNPHADDIDFQIESDFAGLMAPAMPQAAAKICDKIGHIMNYGDGWYGGVYMATMYSLAFTSSDVRYVVTEALNSIPRESTFYQCIYDVIQWHARFPTDWKQTWFELEKKWSEDTGCPDGVYTAFNIDAKLNAAYVVLGLLYGNGDFTKTMDIATRAGQDSDCNPASAGGVLGVILGYDQIPPFWKQGLKEVEDMDFKYTTISLSEVYEASFRQALEMIKREKGVVDAGGVTIPMQSVKPVALEQSFEGHRPKEKIQFGKELKEDLSFSFSGNGIVLRGEGSVWDSNDPYVFKAEIWLDGKLIETAEWPVSYTTRRHELFWKYQLPEGSHQVRVHLLNPAPSKKVNVWDALVYTSAK
ncbi:MAG: ADP-ribosylglycohydrolase family protein, partial [Cyclobacteriaceae bacterium]|nr:ADP-ribosylglycohydrolase family protein [Cyclobacteriaceae bacterium]